MRGLAVWLTMTCLPVALNAAPLDLGSTVTRVRAADYRAGCSELRSLAAQLGAEGPAAEARYRHYWRGFALWRAALNGLNRVPPDPEVAADLQGALSAFRDALASSPDWVEAHLGISACGGIEVFLARSDPERMQALLKRHEPSFRYVLEHGHDNARVQWHLGQTTLAMAKPGGPGTAKALDLFQRGVELAVDEARSIPAGEPAWVPHWGGAENLMNLAYLYTHSEMADRELARAHARGALVAAPEWHYVREVLLPQIDALPRTP